MLSNRWKFFTSLPDGNISVHHFFTYKVETIGFSDFGNTCFDRVHSIRDSSFDWLPIQSGGCGRYYFKCSGRDFWIRNWKDMLSILSKNLSHDFLLIYSRLACECWCWVCVSYADIITIRAYEYLHKAYIRWKLSSINI